MIDINLYEAKRSGKDPRFCSEEKGCVHLGINSDKNWCRHFRVDGGVYPRGQAEKRCDFLLLNDDKKDAYFIELKGSDLNQAISQVENTVEDIRRSISEYRILRRIIYKSGTHDIRSSSVTKWKSKYKGSAVVKQKRMEEKI